ncbi:hypothetical protein [Streptomyces sp. NPDC102360]
MIEGLLAVLGALVGAADAWIAALIAGKASRYQAEPTMTSRRGHRW